MPRINDKTATFIILGLFLLSLLDGGFTYYFLSFGLAEEANPIMNWLVSHSVETFLYGKALISVVSTVFLLLAFKRAKDINSAVLFLFFTVVAIYIALNFYHVTYFL